MLLACDFIQAYCITYHVTIQTIIEMKSVVHISTEQVVKKHHIKIMNHIIALLSLEMMWSMRDQHTNVLLLA